METWGGPVVRSRTPRSGLCRAAGPAHGYGIAQFVQQTSEDVLQVEEGSLYPALQRLLIKGWVAAEWGHSANNRRARYYRLTPAGRKQLRLEVGEFQRVMDAIARVIQPAEG
jgi:transcriptional regulator